MVVLCAFSSYTFKQRSHEVISTTSRLAGGSLSQSLLWDYYEPTRYRSCEKKIRSGIPLKGWKFAGWEGGLAPAQDRTPFNVEFTIHPANLHLESSTLPIPNCLTLNCQFGTEWHSILSGGKPTFPTCEFPSLEWCCHRFQFLHSLYREVVLTSWDRGLCVVRRAGAESFSDRLL